MKNEVREKLLGLIIKIIKCDPQMLKAGDVLLADLGYDSITIIELQVEIEDEFGFLFNALEDDFEEIFLSVDSLYESVRSHMQQN